MIAREKWSCCEVGKGLGLVLCQSHEWNFVNAATAVSPGLQQASLVLAGHHLWVPHVPGGHSFTDLFLPLVREVHWEAEAVEDQLQEERGELCRYMCSPLLALKLPEAL